MSAKRFAKSITTSFFDFRERNWVEYDMGDMKKDDIYISVTKVDKK